MWDGADEKMEWMQPSEGQGGVKKTIEEKTFAQGQKYQSSVYGFSSTLGGYHCTTKHLSVLNFLRFNWAD